MSTIATVDEYIDGFDSIARKRLEQMRQIITSTAPNVTESISYGMPAYKLNNTPLVYFAGYEKHTGFYATPNGHEQFEQEFAKYKQGKGSVRFPYNELLPIELVKRVVLFRTDQAKM